MPKDLWSKTTGMVKCKSVYDLQYEPVDYGDIERLKHAPLSTSFQIMCELKEAFKANDIDQIVELYHRIDTMPDSMTKQCAISVWSNEMRVQYETRGIK